MPGCVLFGLGKSWWTCCAITLRSVAFADNPTCPDQVYSLKSRCIFRGDRCNMALWEFLPDQERRLHDDPWMDQMHEDYPQVLLPPPADNPGKMLSCTSIVQPHATCCFQSGRVEQLVGMAYTRAWCDICKSFVAASSAAACTILGFNLETAWLSVSSLGAKQIASELHLGISLLMHKPVLVEADNQWCMVLIRTKNSVPQMRLTHKRLHNHWCTFIGHVLSCRYVSH